MPQEYGRRQSLVVQAAPLVQRADSLSNALSGFGGVQDRTSWNYYGLTLFRDDGELTSMFAGGGLARKIVSCRPDDMVRNWIRFPKDTDGKLLKALDALSIRTHIKDLLTQTELYRGAIMVLGGLDNALTLSEPLAKNAKEPIGFIKVYGAPLILNTVTELNANPKSLYFEDWETFRIQRRYSVDGSSEFQVHASRCIVSKGIKLPEDRHTAPDFTYHYWGIGRLQAVFEQLSNSETAQKAYANLIHEATIAVSKIPGLMELLAGNDEAAANLKKVMDNIAQAKSVLNMVLLPDGGEFGRDSLSMSGWRDTAMIFREELAAVAEIPVPRLYGIPSAGLGGGGSDSEATENYNASIEAEQEIKLRPIIARIVRHVAPTVGMDPEEPFVFNPLDTPSAKEEAETRKIHAETAKIYVDMGAIDAVEEVRASVFGGESYSADIKLSANFDPGQDDEIAQLEAKIAEMSKAAPTPAIPAPKMPPKPKGASK